MDEQAFQDQMVGNFCWGCGADNPDGLQLKSHWEGDVAVARWRPDPRFAAGPRHIVNGGIIATLLDCHAICTAIAAAYRREDRSLGTDPDIWCATAAMQVEYLRPTPIGSELRLVARVTSQGERDAAVDCSLEAAGKERARASVRAVRVPPEWRHGPEGSGG